MKVGDLVEWQERRWLAVVQDRQARLTTLLGEDGTRVGVPSRLDQGVNRVCRVIDNPSENWPTILHKTKRRLGKLLAVQRSERLGAAVNNLRPFYDWILSDPEREGGGPIFFSPALGLNSGEVLLALFEKGTDKIVIPVSFGTTRERASRANEAAKEPLTIYDRLLDDDHFGNDDDL